MRCLTITLNAAVDATYLVDHLTPGDAHRTRRIWRMPGGKGNNVARVLAARGHDVTATGFLAGHAGRTIERGLTVAGVRPAFVQLGAGESRTCHTILEEGSGRATEILEAGPEVTPGDGERLLQALPGLLEGADVAIVSGSAPVGIDAPYLERLAEIVRAGAGRMAVDSSGDALVALLTGHPDLVKPNAGEMAALMGQTTTLAGQVAFARDDLIGRRMAPGGRVLLSLGADGAALVTARETIRARPPAIRAVNTVGSGDALLAGFVDAWLAGCDAAASLRHAVAFGAAAALQPVAGVIDPHDIERLYNETTRVDERAQA